MLTDFNRALNLKTHVGDAASKASGDASRILGSLNSKLFGAREQASSMYRAANDTYRQHIKGIDAIEPGKKPPHRECGRQTRFLPLAVACGRSGGSPPRPD